MPGEGVKRGDREGSGSSNRLQAGSEPNNKGFTLIPAIAGATKSMRSNLVPHRGRVSNLADLPAARGSGGLQAGSSTCGSPRSPRARWLSAPVAMTSLAM